MSKKYPMQSNNSQIVTDSTEVMYSTQPTTLHLDINLEDNAVVADIKKAIKMIKGIAAVRVSESFPDNVITPELSDKIAKARQDYSEGKYTECRTKEELEAFLEAL